MVVQWGMSDKLGPISYSQEHDNVFLGRDLIQHNKFSQKTSKKIDQEVKSIISRCYNNALKLLKTHQKILISLAEALIERETVDGKEIKRMMGSPSKKPATA